MDLEMPDDERPTTLKKVIKRFFTKNEWPYGTGPKCSGCQSCPRIHSR